MRGNGYKHVVYCRLCLYLFRSDMPFTTNYTSAAFHQKVGETTVEKGEHDNERTNLRAGALLTSTCTGPDEIGKVDPKSTEARTKDQTKQKVSWRNPVPWHTAGPVTTCLSLWMTILKKRKKIELQERLPACDWWPLLAIAQSWRRMSIGWRPVLAPILQEGRRVCRTSRKEK